jgi:dTMP kinase
VKMGKFIVLEGCEGSGKTTQIRNLCHFLVARGIATYPTKQPGGTVLGDKLRHILLNYRKIDHVAELLIFQADRAQHTGIIRKALELGEWVICDRYIWSTIAYQGAGHGLPLDLIDQLNIISCRGLKPDYTILLDIDPAVGLSRKYGSGVVTEFEKLPIDFHRRVADCYRNLAAADSYKNCCILDASGSEAQISQSISAKIWEIFSI